MNKVDRPEGLIRIASSNQIEKKQGFRITTRMIAYAALWTVLITILSYLTFSRTEVEATILRAPGQLFQKKDDGTITNLYTVNLVNKSFDDHNIELKVVSPMNAGINIVGKPLSVKEADVSDGAFFISLPLSDVRQMKTPVQIDIISNGKKLDQVKTMFIGPVYKHPEQEKENEHQQ
jgi:polyferredoxin